jgi:serine/threonine protein kinase
VWFFNVIVSDSDSRAYLFFCAFSSAIDKNTNKKVAIKKITRAFDDLVDGKRIIRELKLLRHFRHENVVGLLDLIHPAQNYEFEDM